MCPPLHNSKLKYVCQLNIINAYVGMQDKTIIIYTKTVTSQVHSLLLLLQPLSIKRIPKKRILKLYRFLNFYVCFNIKILDFP